MRIAMRDDQISLGPARAGAGGGMGTAPDSARLAQPDK